MPRWSLRSALLFTFALAGAACDASVRLTAPLDTPLVEVLAASATAGTAVPLRINNASATRWDYNACASPLLQRLEAGEWVNAPDPLILCAQVVDHVAAGQVTTLSIPVPMGYVAGTYRVRFHFTRSDGTLATPVTNTFTVQ